MIIDFIKTSGTEDKLVLRACRRMEQRLSVLQLRSCKALRARRHKAWEAAQISLKNGRCGSCCSELNFADFVKSAEINGRGNPVKWVCPVCGFTFFDLTRLTAIQVGLVSDDCRRHLQPAITDRDALLVTDGGFTRE